MAEITKDPSKAIVVERTKVMWKPDSLLCKRFNIAEPFGGLMEDDKKKSKNKSKMSVFDYLETSVNRKEDFQTPVIIPKHIEKPQELIKQTQEDQSHHKSNLAKEDTVENSASLEWQDVLEGKTRKPEEKAKFVFKPKTDLERQVVESLDKPITEKKELFKSIFSDSESDDDDDNEKDKTDESKAELVQSLSKPLNAAAANLLRNNSPPRGIFKALFNATAPTTSIEINKIEDSKEKSKDIEISKEGKSYGDSTAATEAPTHSKEIPKASEPTRILFQPKSCREPKQNHDINVSTSDSNDMYGPALPKASVKSSKIKTAQPSDSSVDAKLLELFNKHKASAQLEEVWVEKGSHNDSCDSDEDSSSDDSSSSDDAKVKHKKRTKKSKKTKSSSDHKHKKHKDHKSSKKSKKSEKKKKKHKRK